MYLRTRCALVAILAQATTAAVARADVPACPAQLGSYVATVDGSAVTVCAMATPRPGAQTPGCPFTTGMVRVDVSTGSTKMFLGPCVADPAGGSSGDAGTPCFLNPCVPAGTYEYGYQNPCVHRLRQQLRRGDERGVGHGRHGLLVGVRRRRRCFCGHPRDLLRHLEGRRRWHRRWRCPMERSLHRAATGARRRLLRLGVARRLRPVGPVPSRRRHPLPGLHGGRQRGPRRVPSGGFLRSERDGRRVEQRGRERQRRDSRTCGGNAHRRRGRPGSGRGRLLHVARGRRGRVRDPRRPFAGDRTPGPTAQEARARRQPDATLTNVALAAARRHTAA